MAIRTGMTAIVAQLRQYGQAAPDDVFDGVTYWTDEQLQQIADRTGKRGTIKMKAVSPDGKIYRLVAPSSFTFEDDIVVYNSSKVALTDPFTYNADTHELTFTTGQTSDTYAVYGFAVDIYEALAELWDMKASQRFNYIDWKAQNNKMNMKQEYDHCVARALFYRGKKIRTFSRGGKGAWFF